MDRQEVVERLAGLRRDVEAEADILEFQTSFALALWDVCGALRLTEVERTEVLGQCADARVQGFLGEQVWTVELPVAVVV